MLGFSSEGTGGQDLGSWRRSFSAAFADPEDVVSVNWGGSSHTGGELQTKLTNVNAYRGMALNMNIS